MGITSLPITQFMQFMMENHDPRSMHSRLWPSSHTDKVQIWSSESISGQRYIDTTASDHCAPRTTVRRIMCASGGESGTDSPPPRYGQHNETSDPDAISAAAHLGFVPHGSACHGICQPDGDSDGENFRNAAIQCNFLQRK